MEVLQECRESMGGQGFLASNKIGPMITDTNVDVTFEGARPRRAAQRHAQAAALRWSFWG